MIEYGRRENQLAAWRKRQEKWKRRSAERNLLDFDVAQALVNYADRDSGQLIRGHWGMTSAFEVRCKLCELKTRSNKVPKDKLVMWLREQVSGKIGAGRDQKLYWLIELIKKVK